MSGPTEAGVVHEFVTARPAAGLRHVVRRYIGYRLLGFPPGVHRGLPSPNMAFIVSIDRPVDIVAQTDRAQPPGSYRSVVGGLHSSPALIAHDGNQEGVAIQLTPLGSRTLFGVPAGELCDLSVELADVSGASAGELWERLQYASGWRQRFDVCDDVLTGLAEDNGTAVAPELRRSWDLLVRSGGRITVRELAAQTGYSRQHLVRRFDAEFGLGPKLAARVVRFDRARQMLMAVPSFVSIGQVAAACGYYDQAHLNRDFADLAGCTPTELVREETTFVQDDGEPAAQH
jgi:AraC-like DNA-binding protein